MTQPDWQQAQVDTIGSAIKELRGDRSAQWLRIPVESWWSVTCDKCGAEFNGAGQRLRSDWRGNPSVYDDEIGAFEVGYLGC